MFLILMNVKEGNKVCMFVYLRFKVKVVGKG
jgi:hypothetical protein